MDDKRGIFYILTNDAMPGLVKIGKTQMDDVQKRMDQLYSGITSVPLPFHCLFAAEVEDCDKMEKLAHRVFKEARLNPRREFFIIDAEAILEWVRLMNLKEVTPQLQKALDKDVTKEEKDAVKKLPKRPPLNFFEMGMHIGDELVFVNNPNVKVIIQEAKKVTYKGELYSLTAVTKILLNKSYDVQPTSYWTYNGRNLHNIYDETYPLNEE
ncbi:MAG: GIY-YIG nuclease family protein [Bacteroidales bacterium]|nr:GIY-YIG nuclease family protein [Bacteroidales bacterium]